MIPQPGITDHPARILIVDDEAQNRELLGVMLTAEGFDLRMATSGKEALATLAREPPDLILLDVMMPEMDGYEVARRVKRDLTTKSIPIIMVTALNDRDARLLGLTAGAEDFLGKPIDRAELRVRVRNLLRLKANSDEHERYTQVLEGEVASRTADLLESERLHRSTFDAAPVGIVHVDLDGTWRRTNQHLCGLLGYSSEELQSRAVQERIAVDDSDEAEPLRQMAAGELHRYVVDEKEYRRRDGSRLWARTSVSVQRDAQGRARYFIRVIEDITDRRALEKQAREAGKMDAVGRLASGVAHDFNNLLTVILGFAELMVEDPDVARAHRADLDEIIKAGTRAAGLTKQLLAFSRQQLLRTQPLEVNALIGEMTAMLTMLIGADISISLVLAPDLPLALADRGQLEQVIMNLVVNARDAMPGGGTLTIETADVAQGTASSHEEEILEGDYVMIAVTDTGTGMTEETRQRVFEPFFTTKEAGRGTGLGLSTTYGIVKQSKGYIWVRSEMGRGSTFKVFLPRSDRRAVVSPAGLAPRAPDRKASETVLLVEDEPGVRRLLKRILDNVGYHVLEASNGNDAETMFRAHAGPIDLVVTDVVMPGCGGFELMRRLRADVPALKALYMSGDTDRTSDPRAEPAGLEPFVQKPFSAEEFAQQVRGVLG